MPSLSASMFLLSSSNSALNRITPTLNDVCSSFIDYQQTKEDLFSPQPCVAPHAQTPFFWIGSRKKNSNSYSTVPNRNVVTFIFLEKKFPPTLFLHKYRVPLNGLTDFESLECQQKLSMGLEKEYVLLSTCSLGMGICFLPLELVLNLETGLHSL